MRVYFLDTSAIVRLYVVESGWQWMRNVIRSALLTPPTARVFFCDIALPETVSALRQVVHRPDAAKRGLSAAALKRTLPRVRTDLLETDVFVAVPASGCIRLAADVVERQDVRGADAIHVAAAMTVRDSLAGTVPLTFVSHDVKQCQAADREGLQVLIPG